MRGIRIMTGLAGAAVGVAAALAGHAGADTIGDDWPYGAGVGGLKVPGFYDPRGGTDGVFTVYDGSGGPEWYTARISTIDIPVLFSNEHAEVLSVLDDSAGYPNVGTVFDRTELLPIDLHFGGILHLITSSVVNDPELGYASQFTMFPLFSNTFLYTDDGIKDVVSTIGMQFTLFEIPFTDDSGGADASDAADGFAQLLAELAASAA